MSNQSLKRKPEQPAHLDSAKSADKKRSRSSLEPSKAWEPTTSEVSTEKQVGDNLAPASSGGPSKPILSEGFVQKYSLRAKTKTISKKKSRAHLRSRILQIPESPQRRRLRAGETSGQKDNSKPGAKQQTVKVDKQRSTQGDSKSTKQRFTPEPARKLRSNRSSVATATSSLYSKPLGQNSSSDSSESEEIIPDSALTSREQRSLSDYFPEVKASKFQRITRSFIRKKTNKAISSRRSSGASSSNAPENLKVGKSKKSTADSSYQRRKSPKNSSSVFGEHPSPATLLSPESACSTVHSPGPQPATAGSKCIVMSNAASNEKITGAAPSTGTSTTPNQGNESGSRLHALLNPSGLHGLPSQLLSALGPRMHGLIHRSSQSGSSSANAPNVSGSPYGQMSSRIQTLIQSMAPTNDESVQLQGVMEVSQLLLMGNEETLGSHFPIKQLVQSLSHLLSFEHNYDLMTHACRALTYVMEALPKSTTAVCESLPLLLDKLQRIECMDVAEQSLTALEMLSKRHSKSILCSGGVSACLSYIDFFSISAQRSALNVVANCCYHMSNDDFKHVAGSLPALSERILAQDKKCVESVCLCFTRLVDNYQYDRTKLEIIAGHSVLQNVQRLLVMSPPILSTNSFVSVVRLLHLMCAGNSSLAVHLLNNGIGENLRFLLLGISSIQDSEGELVARTPQEYLEIVCLISELIPPLPKDGIFAINSIFRRNSGTAQNEVLWQWKDDNNIWRPYSAIDCRILEAAFQAREDEVSINALGRTYTIDFQSMSQINEDTGNSRAVQRKSNLHSFSSSVQRSTAAAGSSASSDPDQRLLLLQSQPAVYESFGKLIFPLLYEIFNCSAGPTIKHECMVAIRRLAFHLRTEVLEEIFKNLSVSSHLASMLNAQDMKILVGAVQLAHILLQKCPDVFVTFFRREGVVHQLEKLRNMPITSASNNVVPPSFQALSRTSQADDDAQRRSSAVSRSRANQSTHASPTSPPLKVWDQPDLRDQIGDKVTSLFATAYQYVLVDPSLLKVPSSSAVPSHKVKSLPNLTHMQPLMSSGSTTDALFGHNLLSFPPPPIMAPPPVPAYPSTESAIDTDNSTPMDLSQHHPLAPGSSGLFQAWQPSLPVQMVSLSALTSTLAQQCQSAEAFYAKPSQSTIAASRESCLSVPRASLESPSTLPTMPYVLVPPDAHSHGTKTKSKSSAVSGEKSASATKSSSKRDSKLRYRGQGSDPSDSAALSQTSKKEASRMASSAQSRAKDTKNVKNAVPSSDWAFASHGRFRHAAVEYEKATLKAASKRGSARAGSAKAKLDPSKQQSNGFSSAVSPGQATALTDVSPSESRFSSSFFASLPFSSKWRRSQSNTGDRSSGALPVTSATPSAGGYGTSGGLYMGPLRGLAQQFLSPPGSIDRFVSLPSGYMMSSHAMASSAVSAAAQYHQNAANRQKVREWARDTCQQLHSEYFENAESKEESQDAVTVLPRLQSIAEWLKLCTLQDSEDQMAALAEIMRRNDVSSFEILHSGFVGALFAFLTREDGGAKREERVRKFVEVFLDVHIGDNGIATRVGHSRENVPLLSNLVSKLNACVSHVEQFTVKVHDLPGGSTGTLRGIYALKFFQTHQLKCQLRRHPSCKSVRSWRRGPVKVDPLTLISSIERYMLLRGYGKAVNGDEEGSSDDGISDGDEFADNGGDMMDLGTSSTQNHYLQFLINEHVLPYNLTIYQAIRQYGLTFGSGHHHHHYHSHSGYPHETDSEPEQNVLNYATIWVSTHTLHYRLVPSEQKEDQSSGKTSAPSLSLSKARSFSSSGKGLKAKHGDPLWNEGKAPVPKDMLSDYLKPDSCGHLSITDDSLPTLKLLRTLYGINKTWWTLYKDCLPDEPCFGPVIPRSEFVSMKLNAKATRQLHDPLIIITENLPSWLLQLAYACPFLFAFETRQLLLYSVAFDKDRALQKLLDTEMGSATPGNDRIAPRIEKRKITIQRDEIFKQAESAISSVSSSNATLEIQYKDEVGTGLGPTLEFYSLISKELQKVEWSLWRGDKVALCEWTGNPGRASSGPSPSSLGPTEPNKSLVNFFDGRQGLYPAPIAHGAKASLVNKTKSRYKFMGRLFARSLMDNRLLDLPLNTVFYRWLAGEEDYFQLPDVAGIDRTVFQSLRSLLKFVYEKRRIESEHSQSLSARQMALDVLTVDGACVEDLELDFSLPGEPSIEMRKNGREMDVNLENVEQYLNLTVHWLLVESVRRQMEAFKEGFESVFSLSHLQMFYPEEMEELFCGIASEGCQWDAGVLLQCIRPDHGYTHDSAQIQWLIQILVSFDARHQRMFLQFITGSPKLPFGGFRSLKPPLTVVRKSLDSPEQNPDHYLPSVMTCVNYLKLPEFSSLEIMRKKLQVAMEEGQKSFHLS